MAPFPVELHGVGVFEGESPVVYLRVRKDEPLLGAYRQILEAMRSAGLELWPHYLPDVWVPHVTLALQDLENRRLPDILRWLEGRRTQLNSPLETLSVVHVVQPEHVYLDTFRLDGAR
jgi:2'-5' RNA ligase